MKVLFYGTPAFALPTLEGLLARHQVVAVVTQPDRPAGRGHHVVASPVKTRALAAGVPVLQPSRLRDPGWPERLAEHGAEVAVIVAFGQILPKAVLDVPARGSINVHASLLPRYRGAAPIAWAIIRGETETGITTFQMDPGMDTGAMLLREAVAIGRDETAGELAARLSHVGARVLVDTLARLDHLEPVPQRHEDATMAPRLRKEDGHVRWEQSADAIVDVIRGCNPWPGGATMTPVGRVILWRARVGPPGAPSAAPGTVLAVGGAPMVAAGDGVVEPLEVQPENRRVVSWAEFLRGARLGPGARFTTP